jgi:hypothetical protein
MTNQEIETGKYYCEKYLQTYKSVKEEKFEDIWSDECDGLFNEAKFAMITFLEGIILKPKLTLKPLNREFKPEQKSEREEIFNLVSEEFKKWKYANI